LEFRPANNAELGAAVSGPTNDDRPPMVVAMQWVSQITTIGLEMVLPAVLGIWLDKKWGTAPWLVIVGVLLGFVTGMYHLLQIVRSANSKSSSKINNGEP
jgi:F0F1-type ATP synthase assembly protein I